MPLPPTEYALLPVSDTPASNVSDFSVPIDLSLLPASFWSACTSADGQKLRFATDDGTERPFDVLDFDTSTSTGWVRVYLLTLTSAAQTIRCYPSDSGNTSYIASDTYGSDNAYDANWTAYNPLNDDANDRTSNGNNLTLNGGLSFGTDAIAGQLIGGIDLDGDDDYLSYGSRLCNGATSLTLSAWVKAATQAVADEDVLFSEWDNNAANSTVMIRYDSNSNQMDTFTSNGTQSFSSNNVSIEDSAWHHVAFAWDSTSGEGVLYVDGVALANKTATGSALTSAGTAFSRWGSTPHTGTDEWLGGLCELQVHIGVRRSANWIAAEYSSTNDNAAFFGTPTWSGDPPVVSGVAVDASGTTLTISLNKTATTDYSGFTVSGYTLSSGSGSGTATLTFTITQVFAGETLAINYDSTVGNVTGGSEMVSFTGTAVTNNSTFVADLSNYVALEETDTAGFPNSPYAYTPAAGVKGVLVFVSNKTGATPTPTFGGTPMTLIHRAAWWQLDTGTSAGGGTLPSSVSVYHIATTTTSSTSIAIGSTTASGSFVAAATLNVELARWQNFRANESPYLGTLPDGSPATTTKNISHIPGDLVINLGSGNGAGTITGTLLDSWSLSGGTVAGSIHKSTVNSTATTAMSATGSTSQRNRGFSSIRLSAKSADALSLAPHSQPEAKYKVDYGTTSRTHTFSGKYWGTPTAIQVRVLNSADDTEAVTWTTVDASPSGGEWSGTLSVPRGGPYYTQARFLNDTGVTAEDASKFYIAILVVMYGQSNSEQFRNATGDTRALYMPQVARVSNVTQSADQMLCQRERLGFGFLDSLWADFGVPVITIVAGQAGTPIDNLRTPAGVWTSLVAVMDFHGGCDVFCWQHGMGNIAIGTSEASYEASLSALHQEVADALAVSKASLPFIIGSPNRSYASYSGANSHNIRKAGYDYAQSTASAYYSHSALDAKLIDSVHMDSGDVDYDPAGQTAVGQRFGITVAKVLGETTKDASFYIASATKIDNTTVDVTVTHNWGTDFTPTSGIEGFEVSFDGGSGWSSATAARSNATTIRLTHASNAADPVLVRYCYGEDPTGATNTAVTTLVKDNSAYAIPLIFTMDPVEAGSTPAGPTVSSATINAAGTTLTLVFDEAVTTDYTGLDVDGYTLSNWAGSGTNTLTATITQVYSDEAPALDYVAATGNLTGVVSGVELADLTGSAITNSSTVSPNPTVTTGAATSIGTATASVPGTVTSEGRESVTERGVVWNTSTGPTTANNKVTAGTGAGAFVASLTGLPNNTLIYFRAYATNASGTSYGAEDTFTTLDDPNPTINSIRFSDGGTRIRVAFSEAVTGTTGFSVDAGTITYVSGSGSAVYLFSFTGTPTTVSYTPGNVVDSISQPLGAFGGTAIEALSTLANKALAIAGPNVRPFVRSFIRRR